MLGGEMKTTKISTFVMVVIISIILLSLNCGREDSVLVARVGGRKITLKEFERELARGRKTGEIKKLTLQEKKEFLDRIINRELKIIDAYQHNLDRDEKILDQVRERKRGYEFSRLIDLEVTQKVVPESEIKDYYEKSNKEVKIRQILVKFDSKLPEQKEKALKRANDIVRRLKKRENFAKLATDVSDDIDTAKKGGDKGFLKWGPKSHENPVYVAAFSLKKNEISDPIETTNGYYIIKVVQIKQYPTPPYDQEYERIRRTIYSVRNKELTDAYYGYLDRLRKKYKFEFNEDALEIFVNNLLSFKDKKNISEKDTLETLKKAVSPLDNFSENEKKLVMVKFLNGEITIEDLINELKKYPIHRRPRLKGEVEVQDFVNSRIVPYYLLEQEANDKNIAKDKRVKRQVNSFKENLMINNIQRIQISDKINVTDEDVRNYYEEHREDYKYPEIREIQQIYVTDKNVADIVVKRARSGENFNRLFHRYNEKESLKKNEGKGNINQSRSGIGKHAFNINADEVTDPIQLGKGFYIVKVLEIKEPSLKTFDEAKPIVSGVVRRLALEKREKEWNDELRSRINYVMYEKNLKKSFRNYVSENVLMIE